MITQVANKLLGRFLLNLLIDSSIYFSRQLANYYSVGVLVSTCYFFGCYNSSNFCLVIYFLLFLLDSWNNLCDNFQNGKTNQCFQFIECAGAYQELNVEQQTKEGSLFPSTAVKGFCLWLRVNVIFFCCCLVLYCHTLV